MNHKDPNNHTPVSSFSTWPFYEEDERETVNMVLASGKVNYWTGDEGKQFENEFADIAGCKHAVALANGTVALELALHTIGVMPGDEVIVPCRTFIATASSVIIRGAIPVMADIDPDSQNITVETIRSVLTPKTKAIIVVHFAGWPCDMEPILDLARKYNLKVIEDCAQAHGARYKCQPVGSLGDVAAFSFCQDKIISTGGEGGMLTTNSSEIWESAWSYKDHGKSYETVFKGHHPPGFRWLHESFGTNWRLTEMQSAIGRVQLDKLERWVEIRRHFATLFSDHFQNIPGLRTTIPTQDFEHSYYKYYTFIRPERLKAGWHRDRIIATINEEGIPCDTGGCSEVYLEKAFKDRGLGPRKRLPVAKQLGESSLMFPVHPTLIEENIEATCVAVEKVMKRAAK